MGTVEAGASLKVFVGSNLHDIGSKVAFEFNQRLQFRGTDFMVYTNNGYTESRLDSSLLVSILNQLLTPTSAIDHVYVKPFALEVYANRTTTVQKIMEDIVFAARYVGYSVESRV